MREYLLVADINSWIGAIKLAIVTLTKPDLVIRQFLSDKAATYPVAINLVTSIATILTKVWNVTAIVTSKNSIDKNKK